MTDEEQMELTWATLPRDAKMLIYETLRQEQARYAKNRSMIALTRFVDGVRDEEPGSVEKVNTVAVAAIHCVLTLLEDHDPELCRDCGEYHDEAGHVSNPKDLS